MNECSHMTPDDYPCPNEGIVEIDGEWVCEDHADGDCFEPEELNE